MAKADAASKVDAIGCAERCETKAGEIREAMPTLADQLTEAANLLRTMHRALAVDCQHIMTFTVTKAMIDSGRETRAIGKYCMTCGVLLEKPEEKKPKKSKKVRDRTGDSSDEDENEKEGEE